MKKIVIIFVCQLSICAYNQEVCNNGIDDDLDGLIDLNDTDCDCEGLTGFSSLVPNPSFEDTSCCPSDFTFECVDDWDHASLGTSDYFNLCYFPYMPGTLPPDLPLPSGGSGYAGFGEGPPGGHEYVGACLEGALEAGVEYSLNLYIAWGDGSTSIDFSIFGTSDCGDLPWFGTDCPIGFGAWTLLGSELLVLPADSSWQEVTLTFTPPINIEAIAIGGPCGLVEELSYYYIDDLTLVTSDHITDISRDGDWCEGNLQLTTTIDTTGGSWQWYKDGIALVGETEESILVNTYGLGVYTAQYSLEMQCLRITHTVYFNDVLDADFTFENVCLGEPVNFENISLVPDEVSPIWHWDFGDGNTSVEESPNHTYETPGTYTVQLVGINEMSCNDTTSYEIIVYPDPLVDFEFSGGCILNPIMFSDLSTIPDPDEIIEWDWDFGDGETSSLENPSHEYSMVGTYSVQLTVTTSNGCSASITKLITVTNGLALDISVSNPTCYGFSDGSIVITVIEPAGEIEFTISNVLGDVMNVDNSNAANTLSEGWYYITVEDGSECAAVDSVFLEEPEQLDIDLTLSDAQCYNESSGLGKGGYGLQCKWK